MKKNTTRLQLAALVASLTLVGVCDTRGQSTQPAPPPAPAPEPTPVKADAPPSLDELLGLTKDREAAQEEPTDIIEKLTGGEEAGAGVDIAAVFLEAVNSMGKSAALLLDQRSAGLATQRFQEEAMLKLDTLIAQAQRQSKPQNKPSSQQSQQQSPPEQQQQDQQQSAPGTNVSRDGDNRPGMKQTNLDGAINETGSEWGNLPPRVRDLLRQGRGDAVARLYERLTEIYYERLAEESQP